MRCALPHRHEPALCDGRQLVRLVQGLRNHRSSVRLSRAACCPRKRDVAAALGEDDVMRIAAP
eukprot:3726832-Prymnesium_polylepis.1